MSIGKFSELRGAVRNSGVNVGQTSFDLNNGTLDDRNDSIPIKNNIGKNHDPNPHYIRKSDVKSIGGYAKEGE